MSDEPVTKPTIETVLERMDDFRKAIETRFDQVEIHLRKIDHKIAALNEDILEVRADIRMLEKMIETEVKPK